MLDTKPKKKDGNIIRRFCQSRVCLPLLFVVCLAILAVMTPVVLVSKSVRELFPPKLKWWQTSIVYQIYPRSFKDSDGDGIGDLPGIISKLDHFTYINVKGIWISPFYPSPMRDFGYDISNFTDVDPLFGSVHDFDVLVAEAHKRDIRVMIDFVPCHTSSDHPWFNKSLNREKPYDEYYIWADGKKLENGTVVEPNNWVSVFGFSGWTWREERKQYYYHSFLVTQPQLNYKSAELREEMKNVLKFWFDRGVDGMRVDALADLSVSDNLYQDQPPSNKSGALPWQRAYWLPTLTENLPATKEVVKEWRKILDSYDNSDSDHDHSKFMVAEVYNEPDIRNTYFDAGADMPFNFDLVTGVNDWTGLNCSAICFRDRLKKEYDTLPSGKWANFVLSNHDNPRASSTHGVKMIDALHMMLLTQRATPTTYYGEEIGMQDITLSFADTQDPWGKNYGPDHYQEASRDPERSPMQWDDTPFAGFTNGSRPWLPVHPNYQTVNVQTEMNSTSLTTIKLYRQLALFRNDEPSMHYGTITFLNGTDDILAYHRSASGNHPTFLIVINMGKSTVTYDISGPPINKAEARVRIATTAAVNEGRFTVGKTIKLATLTLNKGDGLVLEI